MSSQITRELRSPARPVKVVNSDTGIARTVETLNDGLFRVLSLGPGVYKMTVHRPGFADETRDAVTLTTGQTLRVDFSLWVSARAEQINVAGEAAAVDTEQGNIAGQINQIELKEAPLNGNNVFNLLALQGRNGWPQPFLSQRRRMPVGQRSVLR